MNDNEGNNLPPMTEIPEFLQGDGWFNIDTSGIYLDFSKPYMPPRWTLSHDGIPFAKLGDLHVVSGKSGHGKTSFMSQLIACILKGEFGRMRYELYEYQPKPVVLYIDTEMSEDDTIAFKNRICSMSGLDYTKPQEQFKIVRLRDVEKVEERWMLILKAIWEVRPLVCFLDGMLDIVSDYNDQKECQPIIRKCMMMTTHYNMSMWCVLHENPMADKMVGTLGSITQRKVTEVFSIHKHEQSQESKPIPNRPAIYFTVQQLKSRGRDVKDWDFEMTNSVPWGMPVELDDIGRVDDPEAEKNYRERKEADDYFKLFDWKPSGATYTELETFLRSKGVTSHRRIASLFDTAKEAGIIYKSEKKKYHYSGFNQRPPNDLTETLPFGKENDDAPF